MTAWQSRANNRSSIAPDNPDRLSADHRLGYGCLVLGIAYGHRALRLYFLRKSILQRAIEGITVAPSNVLCFMYDGFETREKSVDNVLLALLYRLDHLGKYLV